MPAAYPPVHRVTLGDCREIPGRFPLAAGGQDSGSLRDVAIAQPGRSIFPVTTAVQYCSLRDVEDRDAAGPPGLHPAENVRNLPGDDVLVIGPGTDNDLGDPHCRHSARTAAARPSSSVVGS